MSSSVKEFRDRVSGGSSVLCAVSIGSGVGLGSVPSLLLVLLLPGLCSRWASVSTSSQGWCGGVVGGPVQNHLVRREPEVLSIALACLSSSCSCNVSGSCSSALI